MTWASMACYGDSFTFLLQFPILPTASLAYVNKHKGLVTYKFHGYQHSSKQSGESCIRWFYICIKDCKQYSGYGKYKITGTYYQNWLLLLLSDAHTGFPSSLQAERLVAFTAASSSQMRPLCCGGPFLVSGAVLSMLQFASVHCLVHLMAGKTIRRAPHNTMKNPAR
jgi:hypothetical protein